MIDYAKVRDSFVHHLGDHFKLVSDDDLPERFLSHTALGSLMSNMVDPEVKSDDLCRRVAGLVTDLIENGDEKCQELVYVSFFENMDWRSKNEIDAIRSWFQPSMQSLMDKTLKEWGYI